MNQSYEVSFNQMMYNLNIVQRRNILIVRTCLILNIFFILFIILNEFKLKIKIRIGVYFLIFLINQLIIYLIIRCIFNYYRIENEYPQIYSISNEEIKNLLIEKHNLINPLLDELLYDSKCIICLDYLIEKENCIYLNCGHYFCTNCLVEWYKVNNSCPICKVNLLDPI